MHPHTDMVKYQSFNYNGNKVMKVRDKVMKLFYIVGDAMTVNVYLL